MVFYPFFRDENIKRVLIRDIIILIGGSQIGDIENESILDIIRGESSHYTLPRMVSMCSLEGLMFMCMLTFMGIMLYVFYVLFRPDLRVQRPMRPEGPRSDRTGGSNELDRTRRSNELWEWRVPLRHIDHRVLPSYSLEQLMCCMLYFGELTKHFCLPCYVICVSGISEDLGKAPI